MVLYLNRPFHKPEFAIRCDCQRLLDMLRLQYGAFICAVTGGGAYASDIPGHTDKTRIATNDVPTYMPIDIQMRAGNEYTIQYDGRVGNEYTIQYNGQTVVTDSPLLALSEIFYAHTTYDTAVLALHGAAVAWNGKAYLFIGATGSGKTTLAAYLTSCGFDYITDDCILLCRDILAVYPYGCPLHLRGGGLAVLESLGALPNGVDLDYINAGEASRHVYTPSNSVTEPMPLGGVYFLERIGDNEDNPDKTSGGIMNHGEMEYGISHSGGVENDLKHNAGSNVHHNAIIPLSTNEAVAALMHSPMVTYEPSGDYLRLLMRLAGVECRRLIYRDLDYVAEVVRSRPDGWACSGGDA